MGTRNTHPPSVPPEMIVARMPNTLVSAAAMSSYAPPPGNLPARTTAAPKSSKPNSSRGPRTGPSAMYVCSTPSFTMMPKSRRAERCVTVR
ncbi:MAG TPA: hypothetical protein VK357_09485 [Rubrobacteraceae bacterium]|nr:hypothetical protein [Rubrobacteraceae bacterium]